MSSKGKVQSTRKRMKWFNRKRTKENKMIFRKIFVVFFGFFAIIVAFLLLRYIVLAMQHGGAITISFNAHNEMYVEFVIITIIFIFLITGSIYLFRKF